MYVKRECIKGTVFVFIFLDLDLDKRIWYGLWNGMAITFGDCHSS
jgi:hypothetical protein